MLTLILPRHSSAAQRMDCGSVGVVLFIGLMLCSSAAMPHSLPQHGENDFEYTSAYSERLAECVIGQRIEEEDVSKCRGLVEDLCRGEPKSGRPEVDCLLEEQFAWSDLLRATIPDLIGVAEGKTMIAPDEYIAEMATRFPRLRERCFSFSRDQLTEANRCQIDAAIQDVIWHFDLYDNGR